MNLLAPISSLMQTELITLEKTDSIAKADAIFKNNRLHHIPIVENRKLVGIVSKSDYLFFQRGYAESQEDKKEEELRMHRYSVEKIMTKGIASLEPTDKINVALEIFKVNLFHAIPVIDDEELVGIVTTYDIINSIDADKEVINEYDLT